MRAAGVVTMKQILPGVLAACLAGGMAGAPPRAEGQGPLLTQPAQAAAPLPPDDFVAAPDPLADRFPFACGHATVQFMSGYFARSNVGAHGTIIDYLPQEVRVGVLCNDGHPDWHWFSGVFEALLAYDYSAVSTHGGNYFTGPSALIRYNYVRPECALVPYLQGGAGFVFNDLYRYPADQFLIGESFEFLLRAEAGVHWMVTDNFSLDLELGFQHVSNAGLAARNGGLNDVGAAVGFTYYFAK